MISCCCLGLSSLYCSWSAFIFGWIAFIDAMLAKPFWAIGNMAPRTMIVRQMMAMPKLPTAS